MRRLRRARRPSQNPSQSPDQSRRQHRSRDRSQGRGQGRPGAAEDAIRRRGQNPSRTQPAPQPAPEPAPRPAPQPEPEPGPGPGPGSEARPGPVAGSEAAAGPAAGGRRPGGGEPGDAGAAARQPGPGPSPVAGHDGGPAGLTGPQDLPAGLRRVPACRRNQAPPGGWTGITGAVNLTVPLSALLGLPGSPGQVGGFGPVSAATASELLASAAASPATRWCVTVTGDHGQAVAHGCATRRREPDRANHDEDDRAGDHRDHDDRGPGRRRADGRARDGTTGPDGWSVTATLRSIASGTCSHERQTPAYRLSPALRHLIEIRNPTCTFPGCRRQSRRCDQDHTVPFHQGGRTCECNIAPLCRFHHKLKQADGWKLIQPAPGVLVWITPSGWKYTVRPGAHPF